MRGANYFYLNNADRTRAVFDEDFDFLVTPIAYDLHMALTPAEGFRVEAVSWNAWFALVYLIIAGSIIGFTAYVWLLHWESPTKVGTYAYVNPVVAVALGYFLGGEAVGPRTLLGTLLVLVSVVAITTTKKAVQTAHGEVTVRAAELSPAD